jgi:tetratricopeptide (TPR) repeat protein
MRSFIYFHAFLLLLLACPLLGQEQQSKRKPVLIRVDPTDEQVQETPPEPDPLKAKEHVEVGDFYYRRDNFKAAAERYRQAVTYNPKWAEAYEKLIRALEKQKAFLEAIEVCEQFVESNHSSAEVERFQEWGKKLKEENEKATEGEG